MLSDGSPVGNRTPLTLAPVLQHIPMPVLYGVFLHMGVAALNSIQVSGAVPGCWGGGGCVGTGFTPAFTVQHSPCVMCSLARGSGGQSNLPGADERGGEVSGLLRSTAALIEQWLGRSGRTSG